MHPLITAIFNGRMLVSLLMGFSCGLPLLLTITVLQAWMKDEGVDLTLIGLMALVGLPTPSSSSGPRCWTATPCPFWAGGAAGC